MSGDNGFFKQWDVHMDNFAGYGLPVGWWSRKFEYPWAIQFATTEDVVADMGSGEYYRPFKDGLANICLKTYAVDLNPEESRNHPITYISANFSKRIEELDDKSLDKIFCISVMEECGDMEGALWEFQRLLKPDGLAIITLDVQLDITKPLGKYKAIDLYDFKYKFRKAGFDFKGELDMNQDFIIFNKELNLKCFHCVLRKYE